MEYGIIPVCLIACIFSTSFSALAADVNGAKIEQKTTSYSVGISATRIIYDPNSRGASVTINNPNDYPVLAMSEVMNEKMGRQNDFFVVPPLFRLDGKQSSKIRLMLKTPEQIRKDRETLYWFCSTGIPPEQNDVWSDYKQNRLKQEKAVFDVKVKLKQCIKIFVRPSDLKSKKTDDESSSVTWVREKKGIIAKNSSPFYINPKQLEFGNAKIEMPEYIPPFGERLYELKSDSSVKEVKWTTINDFGGDSKPYTSIVK
ncbi:P pilus assembly chaperone PapD [Grimontella sp. AG753]|nr:P pilus assembly chaperone PapD [Grimontella sp. AG753]